MNGKSLQRQLDNKINVSHSFSAIEMVSGIFRNRQCLTTMHFVAPLNAMHRMYTNVECEKKSIYKKMIRLNDGDDDLHQTTLQLLYAVILKQKGILKKKKNRSRKQVNLRINVNQ